MSFTFRPFALSILLVAFALTGCEPGSEPSGPEQGELQQYLADNPEVFEDEEVAGEDDFDAATE